MKAINPTTESMCDSNNTANQQKTNVDEQNQSWVTTRKTTTERYDSKAGGQGDAAVGLAIKERNAEKQERLKERTESRIEMITKL